MPVSAGVTMVYNIGFAIACSVRRIPILVHHHSYSYLNNHSRLMERVNQFLTEKDGHVFLSETMRAAYDRQYARRAQAIVLPNSFALTSNIVETGNYSTSKGNLKIGHLSNLSIEKGLKTVLDAFAELRLSNKDCELHLAGPVTGSQEQKLLVEAEHRFGASLKIHGPLYKEDKEAFFSTIDCFWFPSQYVNEAQPVVLVEALASGVPSISIKRGCIEWLLGDAGIAASNEEQFIKIAVEHALRPISDVDRLLARNRCKERFSQLRELEAIGLENAIRFLSRN
jgi:glycosyltransferase involved in cell wall biosynthesis